MIAIDMEMPSSCGFCALLTWIGDDKRWFCPATGRRFAGAYGQRQDDCPLLEVTEEAWTAICEMWKEGQKR